MAKRHELKTWPEYFEAVRTGRKRFEIRKDDRSFALGDILVLKEWDPGTESFTGREEERQITFLLSEHEFGVAHSFVAMGFGAVPHAGSAGSSATVDLPSLLDWHERQAADAQLRAANSREAAQGYSKPELAESRRRHEIMAQAGDEVAAFHAGAATMLESVIPAWPDTSTLTMPRNAEKALAHPALQVLELATRPWQLQALGHALRARGFPIPTFAEPEYAAALHWLLGFAMREGDNWAVAAEAELKRTTPTAGAAA